MPCPGIRNRWPWCVPAGTLSTTRLPSSVRTLIFEPSRACARLIGTTPMTSSPSRRKKRSGSTWMATTTSPRPLAPCPLRRSRVPSSVPAGIVIASRFSTRTSPDPWQVGQGCAGTRPPENRREQTPQPAERAQIREVELHAGAPGRAARPNPAAPGARERPVAAQLIVLLPLLGIAQHVVRFVDLLEALRGLRLVR